MYGSAVVGDKTNGGKTDESTFTYGQDSSSYNHLNNKRNKNWISGDFESRQNYNKRKVDSKFVYNFNKEEIIEALQNFLKKPNEKYRIDYFFKSNGNPLLWKLIINGPKGSIYEGGDYY